MNSPFSQQISRKGMKPEKDLSKEFPENLKKYYAFNQVTIVELYFSFIRLTPVEKFSSLPFSTFETSGLCRNIFDFLVVGLMFLYIPKGYRFDHARKG